jgi:UDP-N-acetylmuramoylalanine--D-glutamate ligase
MRYVRSLSGVDYYDDSKATNVGAAVAALDGLSDRDGKVVLILGGRHKGGEYTPLAERMRTRARAALLIGEAAPLIAAALEGSRYPVEPVASIELAVARAHALAQPGDVVLLAPACSSFDMFRSYGHRGDAFQAAVLALGGAG